MVDSIQNTNITRNENSVHNVTFADAVDTIIAQNNNNGFEYI